MNGQVRYKAAVSLKRPTLNSRGGFVTRSIVGRSDDLKSKVMNSNREQNSMMAHLKESLEHKTQEAIR